MIDRRPIKRLEALIGSMSVLSSPARYWLYKLAENLVLYDRLIDSTSEVYDISAELDAIIEEWYEIQKIMRDRFDDATMASLNARVIPIYRMYKLAKRGDADECAESEA